MIRYLHAESPHAFDHIDIKLLWGKEFSSFFILKLFHGSAMLGPDKKNSNALKNANTT